MAALHPECRAARCAYVGNQLYRRARRTRHAYAAGAVAAYRQAGIGSPAGAGEDGSAVSGARALCSTARKPADHGACMGNRGKAAAARSHGQLYLDVVV